MTALSEITSYLDELLDINIAPGDPSNNGLQVEASDSVVKVACAVDASFAAFERAAEIGADFLFVHHGISWGGEPRRFCRTTARRLALLFEKEISLYAMHLPLDAHPEVGHNRLLADMLKLEDQSAFGSYAGVLIGRTGYLPEPLSAVEVAAVYEKELNARAEVFGAFDREIKSAGIISGGGGMDGLLDAAASGVDCLITGEMTHTMYHQALESGITVIKLGHYASETPGVKAVMKCLQGHFDLDCQFMDIPTGL